jgi:HK97 family phage major capsid protein
VSDIEIMTEIRGKDVTDLGDATPEELRGKTPDELAQFLQVLDAHLRTIHQDENTGELREKTVDEQRAFAYGLKLRDKIVARIDEHRAVQEVFRRRPKAVEQAMVNIRLGGDDAYGDVRRMNNAEARDRALRILDDRSASSHLKSYEKDEVDRQIRVSTDIARRILVTENDDYRSAFMKLLRPNGMMLLTEDERRAMIAFEEYRTMAEGATGTGGAGVPVFIDPSIILTAQGSGNPFLEIASSVDVNTNAWKGVNSAGVSWSFDTENTEVSDDSPTLGQPTVNVYMARGFVPYSIEVGMDYPNFASEMQTLLAEGYDELLIDKFSRGSGSGEPNGILTVLSGSAGTRVTLQTAGAFAQSDFYKVWKSLPQRFRRKASWMMSVDVNNVIRQFGTANVFHAYTVNLPTEWADEFFGKTAYESPYFPDSTTVTTNANLLVVGDFKNYKIARRGGMSIEQIPHIFHTLNNRPSGTRGLFAYARIGGDVVNTSGFRILVNT